ncbi:hypothetical protein [Sporosarcina jiandibaonis]|uniref:hypothetical protein n=1 Tax=Sporosarcina jiandibaonis TaxID=2715535 RepID=UPI001551DDFC|nr:hypothetical protein [Sporosarcina jiandibaonis]
MDEVHFFSIYRGDPIRIALELDETNFKRFVMIIESAGVIHKSMVRLQNALNFAYALFLFLREKGLDGSTINNIVRKWFVLTLLTVRYSGSAESVFDYDIKRFDGMDDPLKFLERTEAGELSGAHWDHLLVTNLDSSVRTSPYFNLFLMAQVTSKDVAFLSKSITVQHLIEERGDVHHIFPKKYLQKNGFINRSQYNQIANFVYTEQVVNLAIKDQAPKEYLAKVQEQCIGDILNIGEIKDQNEL